MYYDVLAVTDWFFVGVVGLAVLALTVAIVSARSSNHDYDRRHGYDRHKEKARLMEDLDFLDDKIRLAKQMGAVSTASKLQNARDEVQKKIDKI
jgi:hypothetical protein